MMELVDGEVMEMCWCVGVLVCVVEVKLFPLYSDGGECRHFSPIDALTSIHQHSNSDGVLEIL